VKRSKGVILDDGEETNENRPMNSSGKFIWLY